MRRWAVILAAFFVAHAATAADFLPNIKGPVDPAESIARENELRGEINDNFMLNDGSNPSLPAARTNLHMPISPLDTGAACDVVAGIDGSMTSGSRVLTSSGSTFPTSANGKRVVVTGAGAAPFSVLERGSTISAAGTAYAANDTITLAGGTSSTAAVVQVLTVDGGGAVLTYSVTTAGVYTVVASSLTQGSTSGGGSGFILTPKFVGAPIYGTITAASGGSTATLSVTASNTISSARWYYGTDDAVGLQTALDATKTTGSVPGYVQMPARGCGTTVQLEMPVVAAGNANIGEGEIIGDNQAQSAIYAFAPMTAVLHRSSTFGWFGGAQRLRIEGNGLATYGIYTEGSTGGLYRDLWILNATTAGFRCGNGSNALSQQQLDRVFYRTDPNTFSAVQRPTYGIQLAAACTDSNLSWPNVDGASTAYIIDSGASNIINGANVYASITPGYAATYGIDLSAVAADASFTQVGGALTAGIRINAAQASAVRTFCNAFTGLPNAKCVLIESNKCHGTVTQTVARIAAQQGANLVSQSGTACSTTSVWNNSSATYAALGAVNATAAQTIAYALKLPYVIAQNNSAVANTGLATTEINHVSIAYPALGANDALRITTIWDTTGSTATNTKNIIVRLATAGGSCTPLSGCTTGTAAFNANLNTSALISDSHMAIIRNVNATNSQVMQLNTGGVGLGAVAAAPSTAAIQTSAGGFINIDSITASSSADTITLKGYTIELIPGG